MEATEAMDMEDEPTLDIGIADDCPLWKQTLPEVDDLLGFVTEAVIDATFLADYEGSIEISFALVDDAFIQDLNARYRHKDKPTNVLSFPIHDHLKDRPDVLEEAPVLALGDVVLAFETIQREAKEQNKTFADHVRHIAMHGMLHLIGYDHEADDEAKEMETLEIAILKQLGVENPYETA